MMFIIFSELKKNIALKKLFLKNRKHTTIDCSLTSEYTTALEHKIHKEK